MKRFALLIAVCLMWAMPSTLKAAQERGEIGVFGGYARSYMTTFPNGWNASIAANVVKHLAVVADFSGYSRSESNSSYTSKYKSHNFLFGPRAMATIENRWTPFVHFLAGNYRYTYARAESPNDSSSRSELEMCIGGGLDIKVSDRLAIRPIQVDLMKMGNGDRSGHYGRISFGGVLNLRKGSQK
jgi:hypothetical protein